MTPKNKLVTAGFFATLACSATVMGQSSDALLKKLVDKGILTTKEAEDLQHDSKNEAKKNWVQGAGMPDWVSSVRLYGDFRGRFEQQNADNAAYFDRNRYRYRLRLGLTTTLADNLEVGLRLASGNPLTRPGAAGGALVGGSPITANQDLNSLSTRKFLWIDAAYAKWSPIKNSNWSLSGTIGKMDNPFVLSTMIWDPDIAPEGAALQFAYNFNENHALKGNGGIFVLDELNQGYNGTVVGAPPAPRSHDPYMFGAQALFESKWTPEFETSIGLAVFSIDSKDALTSQSLFYNGGNSRVPGGFLKYDFNPIIGTASATYKLDSFPMYVGKFPIKLSGEYMNNPGAAANNEGYRLGLSLGKAGKKGQWELNYRYQRLEADAWFDALVDDDNGAFYAAGNPQLANTGSGPAWIGGTNVKGHQIIATYSITDSLNFTFIYYLNDLIINSPGQKSDAGHLMADLNWKF